MAHLSAVSAVGLKGWLLVSFASLVIVLAGSCRASSGDDTPRAVTNPFPVAPVSHEGRWLTDAAGRVLFLHGVNMVSKEAPYYPAAFGFDDADAAWLAENGFDVVRLGVMMTGLMPQPGAIDESYLDHLANTVTVLASHHLLVLLDLHQDGWGPSIGDDGFPGWMTLTNGAEHTRTGFPLYYVTNPAIQAAFQSFWDDLQGPGGAPLQTQYAAMVTALARRFADEDAVLGYDLLNEPWPGVAWQPCLDPVGCPALDREELDAFYEVADRAIRSVDRKHLVFGEPFVLFNFGRSRTSIALPGGDNASGLAFHVYPLTAAAEPAVVANAIAWSNATHGALLVGEWGATTDPAQITREADMFDQALTPWIFWAYHNRVVKSLSQPPAGANLNTAAVEALVRPHPLAVAGTPTRVSFDAKTRTLSVAWSNTVPGGRVLPEGTVSSFELPRSVYPEGYRVTATNATVVSAPGAPILTVTTVAGRQTSAINVVPGSN
ncbi:MAG: cellulase family glycosylhydrolase [Chloroflexota bacterium]|nr:cellulase family glycosylhydrolase [Chloroflexota bacterium]